MSHTFAGMLERKSFLFPLPQNFHLEITANEIDTTKSVTLVAIRSGKNLRNIKKAHQRMDSPESKVHLVDRHSSKGKQA